ncbi:tetraacyldisaccharide 4'-kinase [Flavobacterium sp. CBA20B-1]|uniref:tetraacyldisaccharide 4'-kinase n=1 Tax=unclassified Flavobacterium TaxID=196869 RepID=UPI002224FCC8|nr:MULTISPECIES: tetraacyldisaccharide 4'-kinase [unclassified Flavobacterium]WCM42032.1 tetraacyldisaccharide 4'-kinase [Flavobacterium sp. CBA20B-1]
MRNLRKILVPFSLIYAAVTSLRNFLYDKGFKKSTAFNLPIIAVGNLSVGGTGKTPMIEYLIRLLSDRYNLAVLSRGYKRKSKGFYLANDATTIEEIGDEPFQYHSKFKNINVAVNADRVAGVQTILKALPKTDVVLLDDAFQHRKIKAGFYIMLTAFDDLFYNDLVLPAGNLRECKSGVKRADIVVVTKCPEDLSEQKILQIKKKIDIDNDKIFFSTISYHHSITNNLEEIAITDLKNDFIAVAGIAKPEYFYEFLQCNTKDCLTFPDHHFFSNQDINNILQKANGRKIITTEKDYMRLQNLLPKNQLFYLPIEMCLLKNKKTFLNTIKNASNF